MKFTRQTLQEIRDKTDFVEVVRGYTHLEEKGGRWWGLSPFKTEKTPSFTVKPDEGFYYCFATQKGGDLFRFISEMEGLSFPDAVKFLAERAGIVFTAEGEDPEQTDRNALYELYKRTAGTFAWFLNTTAGEVARRYLEQRGVTEESINTFQLGYAPDSASWLYRFLRSKSYSSEFLGKSGLFSRRNPEYPLFKHRIIFPICDERSRVIAFGGRALATTDRAKYINSPDTLIYNKKRILYGIPQALETIREERRVFLAEGYLDVIALNQANIRNAVAPLGTALTDQQMRLLKRWVDEVVLVFDADSAGLAASYRAALTVEKADMRCSVLPMNPGMDPADIYKARGKDGLHATLETIRPAFDFLLDSAMNAININDGRDRELLLRKIFPYIKVVGSEVRREALLEQVSDILRVSHIAVQSDFRKWIGNETSDFMAGVENQASERKQRRDFALVLACLQHSDFFAYLRKTISHDDLDETGARKLFLHAEDAYRHGEELPRGVLDRLQDEELRNEVLERLTSGEYSGWRLKDVKSAARNIRARKLEEKQRVIEAEIRSIPNDDDRRMRQLLENKIAIDQELLQVKARVDD